MGKTGTQPSGEIGKVVDRASPSIDLTRLRRLTDAELEAAEDDGELGGNQHYQDLRGLTIEDLRSAIERETSLISQVRRAASPAAEEQLIYATRAVDDEVEALWCLDLGVASASIALAQAGACPFLSCNGGAFDSPHEAASPQVCFYAQDIDVSALLRWTAGAAVRVDVVDDVLRLGADDPEQLVRFARIAAAVLG